MAVLVIAEHDHKSIKDATLKTLSAAKALGSEIDLLIAGHNVASLAEQAAKLPNIRKVLVADNAAYAHFLPENMGLLVAEVAKNYTHVLTPATSFGKDFLPRAAALLDTAPLSDVIEVLGSDTFKRPIYAGNAIITVKTADPIKLLTIRTSAFPRHSGAEGNAAIEALTIVKESGLSSFVSKEETVSERPELTSARIVISGGRGMGSAENFHLLDNVATKLNAAIGASRAAVDAGFAPNDYQVGQTGKIVAPELYIAVGISGAIQHLAGMKDSKIIVAINKDETAPIFEVADYGLVMDLFQALPELEKALV